MRLRLEEINKASDSVNLAFKEMGKWPLKDQFMFLIGWMEFGRFAEEMIGKNDNRDKRMHELIEKLFSKKGE